MGLRIEALGPLRVAGRTNDRPAAVVAPRLLSILALDANRRLGTEFLIERFWGDDVPATAKAVIKTHVSALRSARDRSPRGTADRARGSAGRGAPRSRACRGCASGSRASHARASPPRAAVGAPSSNISVRFSIYLMTARYGLGRHADALAAYRDACRALARWASSRVLAALARAEDPAPRRARSRGGDPHKLPVELTRFIGRENELSDLAALLQAHRLVTLDRRQRLGQAAARAGRRARR